MRILWLASVAPDFGHARAANTVLACLIEAQARAGHAVGWATLEAGAPAPEASRARLAAMGAADLGAFDDLLAPRAGAKSRPARWIGYLRALAGFGADDGAPRFSDPRQAVARIAGFRPDAIVLFWDTKFEFLLPRLGGFRTLGYLARPPLAAPAARLEAMPRKDWRWRLTRALMRKAEARHFARLRKLGAATDICALDAAEYSAKGVASRYVPNTWPDVFGADWAAKRAAAEAGRQGLEILGNIGGLDATGNRFGLSYLAAEVLPALERLGLDEPWRINVCGRGKLPEDLARRLAHPRIVLRGFVPDIDEEMLANRIFLLCNNAGPYTGGYTRAIYALTAGATLVAHRRLADSMPELRDGENCLLGDDGKSIAAHVARASRDADLRRRLAEAGRATYAKRFAPDAVAADLMAAA
ncbi:MAG: glycosyltransferase [Tagaea sp.]|nr:glycosyltransferase [Tagaea sp.]